jgi:L-lactate permease
MVGDGYQNGVVPVLRSVITGITEQRRYQSILLGLKNNLIVTLTFDFHTN